jgi:hypothetical protein
VTTQATDQDTQEVPVTLQVGHLDPVTIGTVTVGANQLAGASVAHLLDAAASEMRRNLPSGTLRQRPGDQPLPKPGTGPDIQSLVIEDLQGRRNPSAQRVSGDIASRRLVGIERYGTALEANNGRDAVRDLYEELLDGATYARQVIEEGAAPLLFRVGVYEELLGLCLRVRAHLDDREGS